MKTRFSAKRNALLTPRVFSIGGTVLGVAILLFLIRLLLPGVFIAAVSPLWQIGTAISSGVHTTAEGFGNATSVAKERDTLQSENAALMIQNAALSARAQDLTLLLGTRATAHSGILASVLARPPFAAYDSLVIDQGSDDGVVVGAAVSADAGVPVGTVASVTGSSARVTLFSSPGVKTSGWLGDARVPVSLNGEGGGTFSLSIPKSASTTIGTLVYVAGDGAIPLANIARLDTDPSSAFVDAKLKPLINLFSILWVTVAPARGS